MNHMDVFVSAQKQYPETSKLISRVMYNASYLTTSNNSMKAAVRITGLRPNTLQELGELDIGDIQVDTKKLYRCDVYDTLVDFYLNKRTLPTSKELLDALINYDSIEEGKASRHLTISRFRKMLVKMGFVWKRVPNSIKFVVVEKPAVTFERYEYLKNIIRCRYENKTVFYIGQTDEVVPTNTYWVFAVNEYGVVCSKVIITNGLLMKWFQSDFALHAPAGSVVVIQTSKQNNEVIAKRPTANSFRPELEEWLKLHNVPYHVDLPKAHLYDLVEKFTDIQKLYRVDVLLKSLGYEVVRLPKCIEGLSLADVVKKDINENSGMNLNLGDAITKWYGLDKTPPRKNVVKEFDIIISAVSIEALKEFERVIQDTENQLLHTDNTIDNCIDELFKMSDQPSNLDEDEDSELPSDSDSDSD